MKRQRDYPVILGRVIGMASVSLIPSMFVYSYLIEYGIMSENISQISFMMSVFVIIAFIIFSFEIVL